MANEGTLSMAISMVTTMDIVYAFDVPYQVRRDKVHLLCPNPDHPDHHFGSCYIDKNDNGYYCYVCGAHVNKWEMVLQLNGNDRRAARNWFFKMSGLNPINSMPNFDDPYQRALQLIRRLEHHMKNNMVYNDVAACSKVDSSYGRNINGEYLYSETHIANPLIELYKINKQTFKDIVCHMLNIEIARYNSMIAAYKKDCDDGMYIDTVGLVSNAELAEACAMCIDEITDLVDLVNEL